MLKGLEKACRLVAGWEADEVPRTFVVVPLKDLLQERLASGSIKEQDGELYSLKEEEDPQPCESWGMVGPCWLDGSDVLSDSSEEEEEEERIMDIDDMAETMKLRPLIDGKPQVPLPFTTCRPDEQFNRRAPTIRMYHLKGTDVTVTFKRKSCIVKIMQGNIIGWHVDRKNDAIVNCVGGALHKGIASYIKIKQGERLRKVDVGDITRHSEIPASRIIHTKGPRYLPDSEKEIEMLLSQTYKDVLSLAQKEGVTSLAFPAISCGMGRFPVEKAAKIALEAIEDHLEYKEKAKKGTEATGLALICFVLPDDETWRAFVAATDLRIYKGCEEFMEKMKMKANNRLHGK